jgi:hypothetical protein
VANPLGGNNEQRDQTIREKQKWRGNSSPFGSASAWLRT